jgi:glycosyltransferase involved in cell wall biosynthesis
MEALEAAVPVVAFGEVTGAADLLARGCGEIVPPFDTKAMAAAILSLLSDDERAREYGRCGRAIVRREYAFTSFLQDLLALTPRPVPRVSVIVPSYNYARYIRQRLASITGQTVPPYEIIVLDDASTDGSVHMVEAALSSCPLAWTVVVNDRNSGSVWAQWRRGVAMARGDFVWIAEADDLADPGFLAEVLAAFERPEVVMSYCQSRQIDAEGHVLSRDYLDYLSDVDPERWTQSYVASGSEEVRRALFLKNTIPNVSAVVFRRDALLRVLERHADEIASFHHAGDWLAYVRLLESGSLAFSPRPLNAHRRHPSGVTVASFGLRHLHEVMQVQRDTIARYNLGALSRDRAGRYAQRLYEQFGLATAECPTIDTHRDLKGLVFTEK